MSEIWLYAVLTVAPEQVDEFAAAAEDVANLAAKVDLDTLHYRVFLDRESGRATFLEHYRDSEAFLAHHAAQDGEMVARVYATCSVESVAVHGELSPAAFEVLSASGVGNKSVFVAGFDGRA